MFKINRNIIIGMIAVGMIIFSSTISISCATQKQLKAYEEKLKDTYPEVVYIEQNRFIAVDKKGNIFVIKANGKTTQILSLADIESGLDREFTLKDIQKPTIKNIRKPKE